jgi:S1-C subfamily serine protease
MDVCYSKQKRIKVMKIRVLIFAIIFFINFIFANELPTKSVVKIFTSISIPDYKYPWQTNKVSNFLGSGAIIEGNRILTSAHVVSNAVFIEVKKENDPKKYIAKRKFISHHADLALLEVEDKNFFVGTKPLLLNENVKHRQEVTVLGYPIGGNAISTTTGVISRIEYTRYVWSSEQLLAIQIDAAINSGNSGGPAINSDGELVGIAMQSLTNSSNIAYIVPAIIINSFLDDTKDGIVNGFPKDNTVTSMIENESMKKYYGLKNGDGVLVTYIDINEKDLKVNDIILEVDGKKIANNGTIETKFGRVSFQIALDTKHIGEKVKLKVLRDKKIIDLDYTLKNNSNLITHEFESEPRYIIFGGLTFTPLTINYLKTLNYKMNEIKMLYYKKEKTKDQNEIVIWMQAIFPHQINRGYYSGAETVEKVNDIKVKNFKHFIELLDESNEEFTVIDLLEKKRVILKTNEAKNSFDDLKKIYHLDTDRREESRARN